MRTRRKREPIADDEWNITDSTVPRENVFKCLHYEYAREFIKTCGEAKKFLLKMKKAEKVNFTLTSQDEAQAEINRILGTKGDPIYIYSDIETVPWIQRERQWEERRRLQKTPEITPEDKEKSARHFRELFGISDKPSCDGLSVSLVCDEQTKSREFQIEMMRYQEKGPLAYGFNGPEMNSFDRFCESASYFHKWGKEYTPKVEFGFFAIDWDTPKTKIKKAFESWLERESALKQSAKPKSDKRAGISPENLAYVKLRALGACRVRATGRTIEESQDYTQKKGNLLYEDQSDWSKAGLEKVPTLMGELFSRSWVGLTP